ncbi:MAG: hypothetical protein K8H85_10620 [Cyclobacteriaceae bacterium]|nr:hypothetical protein [Cyclobacteriaceae bacterium]
MKQTSNININEIESLSDRFAFVLLKHLGETCIVKNGKLFYKVTQEDIKVNGESDDCLTIEDASYEPIRYILENEGMGLENDLEPTGYWELILDLIDDYVDPCLYPVYNHVLTGKSYLIVHEVHVKHAMLAQIMQNPWVVPDEIMLKYLEIDEEWCKLANMLRTHYNVYGSVQCRYLIRKIVGSYAKLHIDDIGGFSSEAMTLFKPAEILSTFDRKSQWEVVHGEDKFFIFDVT